VTLTTAAGAIPYVVNASSGVASVSFNGTGS
jgi:hypothetical protein